MSARMEGGGEAERRLSFLSAHRCPEVERPRYHGKLMLHKPWHPDTKTEGHNTQASKTHKDTGERQDVNNDDSHVCDAERKLDTPSRALKADYLDVRDASRRSASGTSEEEESEEEEGSVSDWSEEDLSLHFSPSVILPSDESGSDSGSGFECIDVAVENQAKGQERRDSRTVPKRQIQLRRRDPWDSEENINLVSMDRPEVREREAAIGGGGDKGEVSANELLCSPPRHRPELLLRQHSMPATFHERLATNPDDSSTGVYKGTTAGDGLGFHGGVSSDCNPRQRLQKSFSLDETKTKIASCIIKSVLSKKMQVEQNAFPPSESQSYSCSYTNSKNHQQGTDHNSTETSCINNMKNSTSSRYSNTKDDWQETDPVNSTKASYINNIKNSTKNYVQESTVKSTDTGYMNKVDTTTTSYNDMKNYVQESGQINSTDTSYMINNIKNSTVSSYNNTKNYLQGTGQFNLNDTSAANKRKPPAGQYWQGVKPLIRQSSSSLPVSQGGKPAETGDRERKGAREGIGGDREREGEREGIGGGGTGELKFPSCSASKVNMSSAPGIFKAMAPVHVVRDMRSLVKKSYNLSFNNNNGSSMVNSAATKDNTIGQSNTHSASYSVIGQKDSPPPSYQQVLSQEPGVKGCKETMATRRGSGLGTQTICATARRGYVAKVTAALQQSQESEESGGFSYPRRGSQPIRTQNEAGESDQIWPTASLDPPTEPSGVSQLSDSNQSEHERSCSLNLQQKQPQAGTTKLFTAVQNYFSPAMVSYQPPSPSTTPGQPRETDLPQRSQGKSTILGGSSSSTPGSVLTAPGPSQPLLHSYFYPPGALAGYPAFHAHMGNVGYIQGPVSYIPAPQAHLQPVNQLQLGQSLPLGQVQTIPTFHLLQNIQSEQGGDRAVLASTPYHSDGYQDLIKCTTLHNSSTTGSGDNETHRPASMETQQQQQQRQQLQQQQFVCGNVQGFIPTRARDEFHQDRTGVGYSKMASTSFSPGNLYSGHAPPHMLLDPESGQCFYMDAPPQPQRKMLYDPETGCYVQVLLPSQSSANTPHTATVLPVGCSAVPYHPYLAMPAMYASHCQPFTLQTHNLRNTEP